MTPIKDTREYECDNEQDEDLIGPVRLDLSNEERLLETMVVQAIEDCRKKPFIQVRGQHRANPLVRDAFLWLLLEHEDDLQTPMTFAWICNELDWQPENFRRHIRKRFTRLYGVTI